MDIELIDNNKIKINVSNEELLDYSVSYERLSSDDPDTRRMILQLLDIAKTQVGFEHKNKKLYIETFPDALGGCVLYFSVFAKNLPDSPGKSTSRRIYMHRPVTFLIPDVDILYSMANYLVCRNIRKIVKSSLYRIQNKYALVIFPLGDFESESNFLSSEFMLKLCKGNQYLTFLEEHASLLLAGNAIETLIN